MKTWLITEPHDLSRTRARIEVDTENGLFDLAVNEDGSAHFKAEDNEPPHDCVWLNLTAQELAALRDFLAANVQPQEAT